MNKIYIVYHEEDGEFIGHGLYETHEVVDAYCQTREIAEQKKKELGDDWHYIEEEEIET